MVKARKIVLAKQFEGMPKESDLKIEEEELPELNDTEILVEAVWLTVDPYMRFSSRRLSNGAVMPGSQVARIIESRHKNFPVGKLIVGQLGWRDRTVVNVDAMNELGMPKPYILPDFKGLPESLGLGMLGMPGNSAYFPFHEILKPKTGETVVVTGAAGALGSHVGQMAKISGCRAVGFAGSDEKVRWLKEELGFDAAYNYKTTDIETALKEGAPNGVDCYFDNVGGVISSTIIRHMKHGGRIAIAGSISTYNSDEPPLAPVVQPFFIYNELKMEGFVVMRWVNRWFEGIQQNLKWILEGKLKYKEHVTEGFENMPKAFIGLFKGENIGKAIVKA